VRDLLAPREEISERKMFGALCFMVNGHMAVGVTGERVFVRLEREDAEQALREPGIAVVDFTGKPSRNMVYVEEPLLSDEEALAEWVDAGADFAASKPPK
jgi:TfoX/Sxy family transcriptional regulator of competence genes